METIQSIVKGEIQDFIHNPITVADGYEFNQYENIKKTHLYLNSKFYSNTNRSTEQPLVDGVEAVEDDRIFFNVTTPRVKAVKRFFDIDVADIVLDEIDPQSENALQLLNKDFDRFAEEHNLSADFNQFRDPYIEYGSLVLEVLKGKEPKVIPLQNYFLDPTVERSADSRFNTIKYNMTPKMLREKVKDGWNSNAIENAIKNAGGKSNAQTAYQDDGGVNKITSSSLIQVYKRYGWLTENLVKEGGDEFKEVFTVSVVALGPDSIKKGNKEEDKDEVLFVSEWKGDMPILDTHLVKTHGRWQGIGIVELLYPIQQRMNEVSNQKRISMEISMLHLFQSADPAVLNNILTDLENGDVISTKTQGSIAPIATEERNLPAVESEIVTYQTQGDKLSFANDLLSGGDIASSTPATNAVIQNNNQVLVHLQDRQNFTNFVGNEYIKPWVVPKLIKEMNDEHFLRMVSEPEDLLQLEDKLVSLQVWKVVMSRAMKTGKAVNVLQLEDIEEEVRQALTRKGSNRYVKILQDYYKNKIGDIIVLIGNEKKDLAKVAGNTLQFFNMIQDPSILDDPVMRLYATQYGRDIGIDTAKLELAYAKRASMKQGPTQEGLPPKKIKAREVEQEDPALASVL